MNIWYNTRVGGASKLRYELVREVITMAVDRIECFADDGRYGMEFSFRPLPNASFRLWALKALDQTGLKARWSEDKPALVVPVSYSRQAREAEQVIGDLLRRFYPAAIFQTFITN